MNNLAKYIDHTLLKPEASQEQILSLCQEAKEFNFASVCVNPAHVKIAFEALKGSNVKVCTVIGFPLGASTMEVKAFETKNAIENGAGEIDMVINIGALKDGNQDLVYQDILAVVKAANGTLVKVILETGFLSDEEKVLACQLVKKAGADFVKTSTGFGPGGATIADIELMRKTVGPEMGVKASGGVRDYQTTMNMINAGATRIGTSSGVLIMKGLKDTSSTY
ncbi:deoxyribose-phosphate aldolase [Alkaliphilus transvaalensis]|uniref:deoxyribose-phosphate aldolase n=1 Tax=Alkaliphilus transvaalensis TaxID=114628 RepID=UPI000556E9DD|nr:deoxyribose-phosphate aldolase [Alkaliphilus transvaalensis]